MDERKTSLEDLMNSKSGPSELIAEERKRIASEYISLCLNAFSIKSEDENISHKDLWYQLLTDEKYFSTCKKINGFALKFLNRSLNEAIVEVEVSNLNQTSTDSRPLLQNTTKMLNFISTNGPHPLVSINLVDAFMNERFGKNWHFTIHRSNYIVSKSVDNQFKSAKELPNTLAF